MQSMHALLCHAVDYAGLFPPASIDLQRSIENYALYRCGEDAWALGNLILPVSALADFEQRTGAADLPVSVVLAAAPEQDLQRINHGSTPYQLFECKLPATKRIAPIMSRLPAGARIFFEVELGSTSGDMLCAIQSAGASAKIRTGGIVSSAIPSPRDVAHFISQCARIRLPFKATAGLHHPVRSQYRLTYEERPPFGTMHGFVNLIFAAALLYFGASEAEACAVLEETEQQAFLFGSDRMRWRDYSVTTEQLADARKHFFAGFGSCSFVEPVEESRALGWIV